MKRTASDCEVASSPLRGGWRCVWEGGGAQCVMMAGALLMPLWSADSSALTHKVSGTGAFSHSLMFFKFLLVRGDRKMVNKYLTVPLLAHLLEPFLKSGNLEIITRDQLLANAQ